VRLQHRAGEQIGRRLPEVERHEQLPPRDPVGDAGRDDERVPAAGQAYRFSVTDQAGSPLDARQCSACLSLLLRAPDGTGEAAIRRYENGAWQPVETVHAVIVDLFQTNPTAMGDYAVIQVNDTGEVGGTILGLDTAVAIGGGAVIVLLVIGVIVFLRIKQAPPEPEPAPRSRIPSKRKGPRR